MEDDDDDGLDDYFGDNRTTLEAARARAHLDSVDDDDDPGVRDGDPIADLNSPQRNCPANSDSDRVEGPEVGAASWRSSPRT